MNLQPGDTYNRRVVANYLGVPYESFTQVKIVQWASTDIGVVPEAPGPSPRFVDAGDLAYFMTCYGRPIRYGFPGENPPNSPTWQCDLNPFDNATIIGAQDFATLVGDLTESCQLSKPGNSGEVAAIMQWFGIAPTGRMLTVGPNGEASVPEYEIVDWEKNRQAIADPYGYLRNLNSSVALDVPWSLVKRLYR